METLELANRHEMFMVAISIQKIEKFLASSPVVQLKLMLAPA